MHEKRVVILIICCCCCFVSSVDMDYFFSNLRENDCSSTNGLINCKKVCNDVPVLCHEGECYCHQSVVNDRKPQHEMASIDLKQEVLIKVAPPFEEKQRTKEPEIMLTEETVHPTRRHHIAHFCPDLDVARKCIRKCMGSGKPAFCGKDHKCYCGHKYGFHDSKDKNNALDTYKEFADMYAKYLGKSPRDFENSDESVEDDENS